MVHDIEVKRPPIPAWFAYIRSCGFRVVQPRLFIAHILESSLNKWKRDGIAVLVVPSGTDESDQVFRVIKYDANGFSVHKPSETETRSMRLSYIKMRVRMKREREE